MDAIFREAARIWPENVEQTIAKCSADGTDPKQQLDRLARLLAVDPYFDLSKETKLHPEHAEFLKSIATLQGVSPSQGRRGIFGGGLSAALIIWWLVIWNRRAERKIQAKSSRGKHYRALLARMSWRYLVVFGVVVLFIGLVSAAYPALTEEDIIKQAALFWILAIVCAAVVVLYSWTLTKRRFASNAAVKS